MKRADGEGHFANEVWLVKKDGSRFWANAITMALKDENGELQGYARVVRDFTDRHERDEKLRLGRARLRPLPAKSTIAGIVSGEFDKDRNRPGGPPVAERFSGDRFGGANLHVRHFTEPDLETGARSGCW